MTNATPIDVLPVINELSRTSSSAETGAADSFQFHEDEAEVVAAGGAGKVKFDRLTLKKYADQSDDEFDFTGETDDADVAPTVVVDDVDLSFSSTSDWDFG